MTETTLRKPYWYKGCIIYSKKNKTFLEWFAQILENHPKKEKMEMHGRTHSLGGIDYLVLVNDKKKVMLVTESKKGNAKTTTIWLKEE